MQCDAESKNLQLICCPPAVRIIRNVATDTSKGLQQLASTEIALKPATSFLAVVKTGQ